MQSNRLLASSCVIAFVVFTLFAAGLTPVVVQFTLAPRMRTDNQATSLNWSGYAVTGAAGSVTDVEGSWKVPAVTSTASSNQYSSFWVGIDGYSSKTVEQIGTDSDVQNGVPTYYAWFEFYPKQSYLITTVTVHAGDIIFAEVKFTGSNKGQFTVSITDKSSGKSFSTSAKVPSAQRSSAEWIVEAPYSGGILPLANFSTVYFGDGYTKVGLTCYATIGGHSGAISYFGSSVEQINMVTSSGSLKDVTSGLSNDGTSFSVTWISAGS
jgi:hypothetical protein